MMLYGGAAVPPGGKWAICNGAELESALWPELFAVIGTTYSIEGTPAGRFNLPNLVDRFAVGQGSIAALGKTGGSRDAVVPTHSHTMDHNHPQANTSIVSVDHTHTVNLATTTAGSHNHGPDGGGQFMVGGAGGVIGMPNSPTQHLFVGPWSTTYAGDHQHFVVGNTAGQTANHTHVGYTPQHTGRSGDEGVTGTNANLPPFVAVNYIIRAK